MKYVFGPVPTRRLGQSLGIDPVPLKTCNWNCIYCQLGRTRPVTNERKAFFAEEDIIEEVEKALQAHKPGEIDWITFVGSGETTLHSGIGSLINKVKKLTSIPVAVITNGSLLYLPELRQELLAADAVLPSLDAGNEQLYLKINRPHPDITYDRTIDGLIKFSQEYDGKLWVELMLMKDVNDTEETLKEIAQKLELVKPEEVHILQPTRPPVESWVKPPDQEGLSRASSILGNISRIIPPAEGTYDLSSNSDLVDAVIGIITRHPMKETEIVDTLSEWQQINVVDTLNELATCGRAQSVVRNGIKFWTAAPAFYPSDLKE